MTYFADLSPCYYHEGALDANNWSCPLLAIGWLESPNQFSQGGVMTEKLKKRIDFLRTAFYESYSWHVFRGLHQCSFCITDECKSGFVLERSNINLYIPSTDCVFAAPGRFDHYIEKHAYQPPEKFLEALMACPDPRDKAAYEAALRAANYGIKSPLQVEVEQSEERLVTIKKLSARRKAKRDAATLENKESK